MALEYRLHSDSPPPFSSLATRRMATLTDPKRHQTLQRARSMARLLDTSLRVPGTPLRFGIDPLLGLIPGVGDLAGLALAGSILVAAARLGAPGSTLLRMGVNVGVDALFGMIPLLGDLFDAGWRANSRNLGLIEAHLDDPDRAARQGSRWLVATALTITAVLLLLVGLVIWMGITLLRAGG